MKLNPYFFILILFFSLPALGQQNYFNVPSFETTKEKKVFFQEQLNIYDLIESNTTLDYGLGNGREVGVNFYGFRNKNPITKNALNDDEDNKFRDMGLVNFLQTFSLNDHETFGAGAQTGLRFSKNVKTEFAAMGYLGYSRFDNRRYRVTVGPWIANSVYTTATDTLNILAALEYRATDTLSVVMDSLGGSSPVSVTVIGLMWEQVEHWPLSLGYQFPNGNKGGRALVFELTYNP